MAKKWKLKSEWYKPPSQAKRKSDNDQPMVGNPRIDTAYQLPADRHMASQACLWACWYAVKTGMLPAHWVAKAECRVVRDGVRIIAGTSRDYDLTIGLPDWPDTETEYTHEEIREAA